MPPGDQVHVVCNVGPGPMDHHVSTPITTRKLLHPRSVHADRFAFPEGFLRQGGSMPARQFDRPLHGAEVRSVQAPSGLKVQRVPAPGAVCSSLR
jgi:hypothetical protein